MRYASRWMWMVGTMATLGNLCCAQQWLFEISGSVGGPLSEWEIINDLEVDESGGIVAVGDRRTLATDREPAVLSFGLDTQGAEMRQYETPDGLRGSLRDAVLESDGSLVACGETSPGMGVSAWIVRLDRDSNAIHWECTPSSQSARLRSIARVSDGYVAVGTIFPEGAGWNTYVVKVDFAGDVVWQRNLEHDDHWSDGYDIVAAPDGGVFVSGVSEDRAFLLHMDPAGVVQRTVRYETPWKQNATFLEPTEDGGLFIASTQYNLGDADRRTWIARVAPGGATIWQYRYETFGGVLGDVRSTPDGGCMLIGTRQLNGDSLPSAMRINSDGEVEWYRYYDFLIGDIQATRGALLPDGGAVISSTALLAEFQNQLRLARVGPNGELDSGCAGLDTLVAVERAATAIPYVHVPLMPIPVPEAFETLHTTPQHFQLETVLHCGDPCAAPVPYCVSSPNSVGPGASIGSLGSTSIASNGFSLTATGLPPSTPGLFFCGTQAAELPFADGTLCVAAPIYRLGTVTSFVTGDAFLPLDLTDMPAGAPAMIPGSRWHFQLWYRDLAGGPSGSNLTNGLDATMCP